MILINESDYIIIISPTPDTVVETVHRHGNLREKRVMRKEVNK